MSSPTQQRGFDAESRALAFLQTHGLQLVARQWRCRFGEIDLIMREGGTLVFVEVRMRRAGAFGGALESLSATKMQRMSRAVELYLSQSRHTGAARVDAVLIDERKPIEWLENITG
jgi:putative endonuclease